MFAANVSRAPKITSDSYNNIFLNHILEMLRRGDANPDSIFKGLMRFYVTTSTQTFLAMPRHRFTHAEDARQCIALLDRHINSDTSGMTDVITYLNSLQAITLKGSFSWALSTYFAVFPEYLNQCSDKLRANMLDLDLWEVSMTAWIQQFMQSHNRGNGSLHHDTLEQLAASIPDNMVDTFTDFLLKQVHTQHHHETAKGLYKGWVYIALGKLMPRLCAAKQNAVNSVLQHAFNARKYNLSLIGLSEALCSIPQDNDKLNAIAEKLYLYVIREIEMLASMQRDNSIKTESVYAAIAFTLLKKLEGLFNPDMKRGLVNALLKSDDNLYIFRHNILELESWIDDEAKLSVMTKLNLNDHFLDLAPMLWHWLKLDKNFKTAWSRCNYSQPMKEARDNMRGIFTLLTPVAASLNLLIADNSASDKDRRHIIEELIDELKDYNKESMASIVRMDIHQAMISAKAWANNNECILMAELLQTSCHAQAYDPDDLRASAGLAASYYYEFLQSDDAAVLRQDLLQLLDSTDAVAKVAAQALENITVGNDIIPVMMTSLMAKKDNEHAQLLLMKLHARYNHLQEQADYKPSLAM